MNRLPQFIADAGTRNVITGRLNRTPLRKNRPEKIVNTQKNHFSACLCGYVKLEMLRFSSRLNHSALKAKIYISALRSAFSELQKLQPLKITA